MSFDRNMTEDEMLALAIAQSLESVAPKAPVKQYTPIVIEDSDEIEDKDEPMSEEDFQPPSDYDDDMMDFEDNDDYVLGESAEFDVKFADASVSTGFAEAKYECLSKKDIIARQKENITQVCEVLQVPFATGRVLLQYKQWDKEALMEAWADSRRKLCKRAGVKLPKRGAPKQATAKKIEGECTICMDDASLWTLACGHAFCIGCWRDYLEIKIKEQQKMIPCPGHKCTYVLDEFTVLELVGDKKQKRKFNKTLIASFVDENQFVRWCPAPGCKYAIHLKEVQADKNEQIKCKCGHNFCFRCSEPAHSPAFCDMVREWNKRNEGGNDALTESYAKTISRPCPRCNSPIEKNGGCNHMTCQGCKFHFCWLCMKKFGSGKMGGTDGYSNHKCNGFFEEDAKVKKSRQDWQRFRFYAERFNGHIESRKIETRMVKHIDHKRCGMQDVAGISWAASAFYKDAVDGLIQIRTVLAHSFIFGYFRATDCPEINKDLFEHQQNELERHCEALSHVIEKKAIPVLCRTRTEVINATKVALRSRTALLDIAANAVQDKYSRRVTDQFAFGGKPSANHVRVDGKKDLRDLKHAMQMSKSQTRAEEQALLERAIQESLGTATSGKSKEEMDLDEAIRRSLNS